jgi:hypothetical protein
VYEEHGLVDRVFGYIGRCLYRASSPVRIPVLDVPYDPHILIGGTTRVPLC